jgi:hypothetical protein
MERYRAWRCAAAGGGGENERWRSARLSRSSTRSTLRSTRGTTATRDVDVDAVVAKVDAEIDAEMETTLRLTREQIEADLRAAGVDIEAEKAKAVEAYEKAQCGETPAPPARSRSGDLN